jgi:hypothetical protein
MLVDWAEVAWADGQVGVVCGGGTLLKREGDALSMGGEKENEQLGCIKRLRCTTLPCHAASSQSLGDMKLMLSKYI